MIKDAENKNIATPPPSRAELEVLVYVCREAKKSEFRGVRTKKIVERFGAKAYTYLTRLKKKGYIVTLVYGFNTPTEKAVKLMEQLRISDDS